MAYYELDYPMTAAQSQASERAAFIRRTYAHLAGAVLAFVMLEVLFFKALPDAALRQITVLFWSPVGLLIDLALVIGIGMLARHWARSTHPRSVQYLGLSAYVIMQSIFALPLFVVLLHFLPPHMNGPQILQDAVVLTLCCFGGLTATVFITRKDFSFLAPILLIGSFLLIGVILIAAIAGFHVGIWWSLAGVALMSAFILYDTSNVLHHYHTDQHVAAALALFASLIYLFYRIVEVLLYVASERR